MKRILLILMAVTLGLIIGFAGKAGAVPVQVTWTGPDDFTDATILNSFPFPFTANTIVSITGIGLAHGHGVTATGSIGVILNGPPIDIATFTAPAAPGSILMSSLAPITFSSGTVSGLRFHITSGNGEFHSFLGGDVPTPIPEVITFDLVTPPPAGVPEPATLLFLGSGLLGLIAFRARFK